MEEDRRSARKFIALLLICCGVIVLLQTTFEYCRLRAACKSFWSVKVPEEFGVTNAKFDHKPLIIKGVCSSVIGLLAILAGGLLYKNEERWPRTVALWTGAALVYFFWALPESVRRLQWVQSGDPLRFPSDRGERLVTVLGYVATSVLNVSCLALAILLFIRGGGLHRPRKDFWIPLTWGFVALTSVNLFLYLYLP